MATVLESSLREQLVSRKGRLAAAMGAAAAAGAYAELNALLSEVDGALERLEVGHLGALRGLPRPGRGRAAGLRPAPPLLPRPLRPPPAAKPSSTTSTPRRRSRRRSSPAATSSSTVGTSTTTTSRPAR